MEITDIKVRKLFDDGPMKAIVSVTFDNELALHDVKVINARDRYFIVMPSRKNPDETYRDIVHPINAQFRSKLENAVLGAYHAAVEAEKAESETADTEKTGGGCSRYRLIRRKGMHSGHSRSCRAKRGGSFCFFI